MSHGSWSTRLIQIDLDYLVEKELTINQYLSLMKLYLYQVEKRTLPIVVTKEDIQFLKEGEYLETSGDEVFLTAKGKDIFEFTEDLFVKFFETFPHKVPDGTGGYRILGTKSHETIMGSKMRNKWLSITKGNKPLQERIIRALQNEIRYRTRTHSLLYMQNMETWLNNGTWEKYEDVQEEIKNNPEKIL